jgi:hypothetical protein
MKYEEIYKDWLFLWNVGAANDMTGGYVDSEDLFKLLKNPSKKTAYECLISQITYWFQNGPDIMGKVPEYYEIIKNNPEVKDLYEKYNMDWHW